LSKITVFTENVKIAAAAGRFTGDIHHSVLLALIEYKTLNLRLVYD